MSVTSKSVKGRRMHKSIEATGAKPGERVKCVGEGPTAIPGRFSVGNTYVVVDFCGIPSAHGHTDFRAPPGYKGARQDWTIPRRGYGWLWERVAA